MRRTLECARVLLLLSAPFVLAHRAHGQWSVPERIDLGGGLAVERLCAPASVRARSCLGWTPTGFVFGDAARWLTLARTFARVPATGRIIAAPERPTDATTPDAPPRLLRSDDRGAHWVEIPWSGGAPHLFAFDATSRDGVAAGEAGHVWTTHDAGDHWTDHGGDTRVWTQLAIAAGEIVMVDSSGNVFRSSDGGFARQTVAVDRAARVEQRDAEIVVHTERQDCIVRHGEGARCVAR
jgi:photosystem II stability/assembly factor-like uncharacterized protein